MSKRAKNEYLMRFYITIGAGVVGLIGIVLLIYSAVDLSDLVPTGKAILSNEEIKFDSNPQANNNGRVAGDTTDESDQILDRSFVRLGPIIRKMPLLMIRNDRVITVATLDEQEKLKPVAFIPGNSEFVTAFEGNMLIYLQDNDKKKTLTLNAGLQKNVYDLPFEKEYEIESVFLDSDQKIFYFIIQNDESKKLVWYIPGSDDFTTILELAAFKDVTLQIDNYFENQIYMSSKDKSLCYLVTIESRRIQESSCIQGGEMHSSNDFIIEEGIMKLYRSDDELVELFPLDGQFFYQSMFLYGDKLYYTTAQVANAKEKSLMEFSLETREHKILIPSLNISRVDNLFRYGNTIFMLVSNSIYTFDLDSEGSAKNASILDFGIDDVSGIEVLNLQSEVFVTL